MGVKRSRPYEEPGILQAATVRWQPMKDLKEPLGALEDLEDIEALRAAKDAERDEPTVSLDSVLQDLRIYREKDPLFERAIADYVDAEASLQEDPAEGQRTVDDGRARATEAGGEIPSKVGLDDS